MIDSHVHTNNSGDCGTPMIEACRAAIDRGIADITFTDHVDFEPTDLCYGMFDYTLYKERIAEAREMFAGELTIHCGIEVDYTVAHQAEIEGFLRGKEFDYILGAAHYVDGLILEEHENYFPGKTLHEAYAPYFENALAAAKCGMFDALAHLDLCKRYGVLYFGPFCWTPHREIIERILNAVIGRGMALEINTSGLRQAPAETYPSRGILELYHRLGGQIVTIGSDAHTPDDIGAGVAEAAKMAQKIGLTQISGKAR